LVITNHYSEWDMKPLCPGSVVKIDDKVITQPGYYTFPRHNRKTGELDSLYRVQVYRAPAYEFMPDTLTICAGDSVVYTDTYGRKVFKATGEYTIKLKTVEGCDSIYHLKLTVNPTYLKEETVKILDDEVPYNWEGVDRYQSGDYYRSWQINGCDSTNILHLTVVPTQYVERYDTICHGDSIVWRGKTYSQDGDWYETVRDSINKHKTVYSLHLTVGYPTTLVEAFADEACADDREFDVHIRYEGYRPSTYSIYFSTAAQRSKFKNVYGQPLRSGGGGELIAHITIPQYDNDSIPYTDIWDSVHNQHYVRPDYYSFRIELDNGVCSNSTSGDVQVLIKYPNWIIQQNWDDVVAPLSAEWNGGYEFSKSVWYLDGDQQTGTGAGYLHTAKPMSPGSQVYAEFTRKGENYAIPTCPITIRQMKQNVYPEPILVNPNQAPRHMPVITIDAPTDGLYDVYTSTGILLFSGKFDEGKTNVTLPAVNGIYFVLTHSNDKTDTHKVIVF
jgi:hypothetical protein